MATVTPRRTLVFKIQKRLSNLSPSQLLRLASSVDDGSAISNVDELSEPELYDQIVDFLRSERLKALEDEGMAQLLLLDDLISDMLTTEEEVVREDPAAPSTQDGTAPPNISAEDRDNHTPSGATKQGRNHPDGSFTTSATVKPPVESVSVASTGRVSLSSSVRDQVLKLNDVAALFPRREFKLHGGQISDVGSDTSYSNLCKQIDEGLQEGFTEAEMIRSVIKIIKPGTFKEMLANKCDLTMDELKRFLRSHIRDKNSTELFQELSNAKQLDKESPQQFLYRMMGLKQRVLFESQQPGAEFTYDKRLVQGTFLHTLYQGLNDKNSHIRQDLKPFLTDMQV